MTPLKPIQQALPAKVALNFTVSLIKRVANFTDPNPVKLAFGIAKAIIKIKDVCTAKSVRLKSGIVKVKKIQKSQLLYTLL